MGSLDRRDCQERTGLRVCPCMLPDVAAVRFRRMWPRSCAWAVIECSAGRTLGPIEDFARRAIPWAPQSQVRRSANGVPEL
eukprot:519934-Alexandrium_andersonii.AAC.1